MKELGKVMVQGAHCLFDDKGAVHITITTPGDQLGAARRMCREIQTVLESEKPVEITAARFSQRRSKDANAYLWTLLDQLAVALSEDGPTVSPEEVYRNLIPHVGGNSTIVPIREDAIEAWKKLWKADRLGRVCEDMGPCRNIPGYHNIRCFCSSSDYDTKQMSRLIDLVVQECKEQGIETKTPEELAKLKELWNAKQTDESA